MATEKRLIDANDVPELLEKQFARKWRLILDGETHLDNLAEGFFSAKSVIWAMPTVDAVEVVRCKDCKYWEAETRYCGIRSTFYNGESYDFFKEDEFCSRGKRKDND